MGRAREKTAQLDNPAMAGASDMIDMPVEALIGATQSALRIDGAELCLAGAVA